MVGIPPLTNVKGSTYKKSTKNEILTKFISLGNFTEKKWINSYILPQLLSSSRQRISSYAV